jgi:hypothetical protein
MRDKSYLKIIIIILAIFFIFGNVEAYENKEYISQLEVSNNIIDLGGAAPPDISPCRANKCYDKFQSYFKSEQGEIGMEEKTLTGKGKIDRLNHFMVSPYFINDNPLYKGKKLQYLYNYSAGNSVDKRQAVVLDRSIKNIEKIDRSYNKTLDEWAPQMEGSTWSLWADPLTAAKQAATEEELFNKNIIYSLLNRE